jgi:IS605 OrfB family transposase
MTTRPGPTSLILTRRIRLLFEEADKAAAWQQLSSWQDIVVRAANWIATHHYIQENLKDLTYLTENIRIRLADAGKDEAGILTTSRMSTTYRLLSGKFKGQIPMAIISSLNRQIIAAFDKEKAEYNRGTRSLRTYKAGLPIPIVASDLHHLSPTGDGDFTFTLYGLRFRTVLGRDRSRNGELLTRLIAGETRLHNSAIEIRNNKLFLLAAFPAEIEPADLSPEIKVNAWLSPTIPIIAEIGGERIEIGTREEFLHRRLAIQESMHRIQTSLRSNRGGKGRTRKLAALDRFHHLERNYVNTRLHQYSARLIAICLQYRAGTIVLQDQPAKEARAKEDEFVLRNWSYYRLKEKIGYKATRHGIAVITAGCTAPG